MQQRLLRIGRTNVHPMRIGHVHQPDWQPRVFQLWYWELRGRHSKHRVQHLPIIFYYSNANVQFMPLRCWLRWSRR
jgi:hypothetical protein